MNGHANLLVVTTNSATFFADKITTEEGLLNSHKRLFVPNVVAFSQICGISAKVTNWVTDPFRWFCELSVSSTPFILKRGVDLLVSLLLFYSFPAYDQGWFWLQPKGHLTLQVTPPKE